MTFKMPSLKSTVAVATLLTLAGSGSALAADEEVATEEASRAAPIEFTGTTSFGPCTGTQVRASTQGLGSSTRNTEPRYCVNPSRFEDPHLQGEWRVWAHNDDYTDGPTIWASRFAMHDDEGNAWVQRPFWGL